MTTCFGKRPDRGGSSANTHRQQVLCDHFVAGPFLRRWVGQGRVRPQSPYPPRITLGAGSHDNIVIKASGGKHRLRDSTVACEAICNVPALFCLSLHSFPSHVHDLPNHRQVLDSSHIYSDRGQRTLVWYSILRLTRHQTRVLCDEIDHSRHPPDRSLADLAVADVCDARAAAAYQFRPRRRLGRPSYLLQMSAQLVSQRGEPLALSIIFFPGPLPVIPLVVNHRELDISSIQGTHPPSTCCSTMISPGNGRSRKERSSGGCLFDIGSTTVR
jgi:hypothetical protein